jgi:uncharacterized protein YdeI (YjbR/CyaY-like superfamily)
MDEATPVRSQEASMTEALDRIGAVLKERGLTLDEMIESGREIRGQITEEAYGVIPLDLDAALQANPAARAAWDALSPSHRREYVQAIEDAKKPETRKMRVEKTVERVREKTHE